MGGSSFRIDRRRRLCLRRARLADRRPAEAIAPRREAHGSVDESLCMPAKALIIVRTLVRTPAIKGSCYAMIGCRHAKAFIIVKTLVCTSAIKGFYYDENNCRPAMNLDIAAIDRCSLAIIDVHVSIDVRRPVEKRCRLAMKHRRPLEAFEPLAIDLVCPVSGLLAVREAMPGSPPSPAPKCKAAPCGAARVARPAPSRGQGRVTCCGGTGRPRHRGPW